MREKLAESARRKLGRSRDKLFEMLHLAREEDREAIERGYFKMLRLGREGNREATQRG